MEINYKIFQKSNVEMIAPPLLPPEPLLPPDPLEFGECNALVDTQNLNLRADPNATATILNAYPFGTPLYVYEQESVGGWVYVQVLPDGVSGWMSRRYLIFTDCNARSGVDNLPTPLALDWITVPAGSFIMGSDEEDLSKAVAVCNQYEGNCQMEWFASELPKRSVSLDQFEIMETEVTNGQYEICVNAGVCEMAGRSITDNNIAYDLVFFTENNPVVGVNHFDAVTFCRWVGARLPTEAEWEKAARSTDGRQYPWGGNEYHVNRANLWSGGPAAVGSYPDGASYYSVQDIAGNVVEWTSTQVGGTYVLRGGSWKSYPFQGRVSDRGTKLPPTFANYDIGFRCAR